MNNELLNKIILEELEKDETKTKIANAIQNAVDEVIRNYFSWNGEGKKTIEGLIEPFLKGTLEEYDFSKYTTKLQVIIKDSLENSKLEQARKNILEVIGYQKEQVSIISLKELFKEYCKAIENETIYYDDLEDTGYVENNTYPINCYCEVKKKSWSDDYEITFSNDLHEAKGNEDKEHTIKFETYEHQISYKVADMKVFDLRFASKLHLKLFDLMYDKTKILDIEYMEEQVNCEVER